MACSGKVASVRDDVSVASSQTEDGGARVTSTTRSRGKENQTNENDSSEGRSSATRSIALKSPMSSLSFHLQQCMPVFACRKPRTLRPKAKVKISKDHGPVNRLAVALTESVSRSSSRSSKVTGPDGQLVPAVSSAAQLDVTVDLEKVMRHRDESGWMGTPRSGGMSAVDSSQSDSCTTSEFRRMLLRSHSTSSDVSLTSPYPLEVRMRDVARQAGIVAVIIQTGALNDTLGRNSSNGGGILDPISADVADAQACARLAGVMAARHDLVQSMRCAVPSINDRLRGLKAWHKALRIERERGREGEGKGGEGDERRVENGLRGETGSAGGDATVRAGDMDGILTDTNSCRSHASSAPPQQPDLGDTGREANERAGSGRKHDRAFRGDLGLGPDSRWMRGEVVKRESWWAEGLIWEEVG